MTSQITEESASPKNLGGRPRIEIDVDAAERAASIGCTNEEVAAVIGIGRTAFYDRVHSDPDFADALERGRSTGRATLRRLQWQRANGGSDTMLIWLGKQMLQQRDRIATTGEDGGAVITAVSYKWAGSDEQAGSDGQTISDGQIISDE